MTKDSRNVELLCCTNWQSRSEQGPQRRRRNHCLQPLAQEYENTKACARTFFVYRDGRNRHPFCQQEERHRGCGRLFWPDQSGKLLSASVFSITLFPLLGTSWSSWTRHRITQNAKSRTFIHDFNQSMLDIGNLSIMKLGETRAKKQLRSVERTIHQRPGCPTL